MWLHDSIGAFEELVDKTYGWAPNLDNIPAAVGGPEEELSYASKVPLGFKDQSGEYYIYNHIDIVVKLGLAANK